MSVLSAVAKLLPAAIAVVPKVIAAIRNRKRAKLADPLGESEAARALRLEDQRRAEAQARRMQLLADDRLCGSCPNNNPVLAGEICGMCGRVKPVKVQA